MKLKSQRLGWALLLMWFLLTSLLLFRFGKTDYGEFDPKLQLQQYPKQLPALLSLSGAGANQTVLLHVLDPTCRCTALAENHLQQLQPTFVAQPHLLQKSLTIEQLQAAGIEVPATPLLIMIRNKQLIYSGPYASGPACSVNDSLLDAVLQQRISTPGSWLNSETAACRCLNQGPPAA